MFKEKILLGQYYPVESPVHRRNAACKILITLLYAVTLFFVEHLYGWLLMLAVCVGVIALSRIPLRSLWRGLRVIAFFCLLAVVLNIFFYPGEVIWQWAFLSISQGALAHGLSIGLRLVLLVLFASLLTLSTTPIQLTDGLESLLRPLRPLHVPAHEIAMMMSIALRFIPTLMDEFERIRLAQQARGAVLDQGNLIRRSLALLPLLIPLFVAAFRRAEELAQAMEARCYRGGEGRSRWKTSCWQLQDSIALGFFAALLLTQILLRIFL
ncbi:MAG: energy-coupling factor transporter transmembrane component T [Bacillota bacterium]|nr:energy-coupling factor transporter transmembrane component T [Bacillota bacterium]